jgi:hypothetical protein
VNSTTPLPEVSTAAAKLTKPFTDSKTREFAITGISALEAVAD